MSNLTTGNVLEDLGFSVEEIREMELKDGIFQSLRKEIASRNLTQRGLAVLLNIHQPDASLLMRGQIARFSITKLLQFAEALGFEVKIELKRKGSRHGTRNVIAGCRLQNSFGKDDGKTEGYRGRRGNAPAP